MTPGKRPQDHGTTGPPALSSLLPAGQTRRPVAATGLLHGSRPSACSAYSLIELLCVMALVLVLLAIALPSTTDWGRGAAMRTSAANLRSSLAVARRWAVSHGTRTSLVFGNEQAIDRGYCVVMSSASGRIGQTNYLAKGIGFYTAGSVNSVPFDTNDVGSLEFALDGSCTAGALSNLADTVDIVLAEPNRLPGGMRATITVYRTTGYARAKE